jgi:hypothetical protein
MGHPEAESRQPGESMADDEANAVVAPAAASTTPAASVNVTPTAASASAARIAASASAAEAAPILLEPVPDARRTLVLAA